MENSIRIDHVNFTVRNLDESLAWYARIFGFHEVESGIREGRRWAIMRSGDALLCMGEFPQYELIPEDARVHRIWHFGLRIRNRAEWEAVVARENLNVEYGGAVRYPHSYSWYVLDPSGHEIEVALWDKDEVSFADLELAR